MVVCLRKLINTLLRQSLGNVAHLLLHLQQLLIAHFVSLHERVAVDIHVMCATLVIHFPTKIVILVSRLRERVS